MYAHHLQYHIKDLIKNLPKPLNGWGKVAIPFVTYGGIHSGIALEEAGKLLKKSGRKVLAGLKVSSSHRMTRAFMIEEYNSCPSEDKIISTIEELVERVRSVDLYSLKDKSKYLNYQSRKTYLKANIVFKEKVWHEKRYPKVVIDDNECIRCGKCINVCPICHLQQNLDKSTIKNINNPCIHCFNCVIECPQKSISLVGNLETAKKIMENMIKTAKEDSDTYLYPTI
ncbi:4Fe-4S dicluster domain-containing protein [Marinisporobacter balticus]|uniref:4Fe-4S dicluster protein n=1 Tax=Marinisporobacter balticus TaxID=2018667 RepID=A0A4R2K6B5_9FIRM|nr:4Fe-4S dicluster domain-containing protein [Marinisporobacter balticus]TCO68803.1 4Fe-4S dicluster protein [Marinisporobacter balticus]